MKSFIVTVTLFLTSSVHADLVRYWTGNADNVRPKLHGPVLVLAGGGGDVTAAMQAAIDRVRGCSDCGAKIDIVVIRASGAEGYNPYFMAMRGVDSVLSMVITDRASASRPEVVQSVREAELVFFAGGDQCNYVRWIKGTPVAAAIKDVYRRGGAIGGTSAGLAIQGQYIYDACPSQSAQAKDVLRDPFHADVSVSSDFFAWPAMRGIVTDTHFQQRDRLGRLIVFLARAHRNAPLFGLGISEGTVALVDRNGRAVVYGKGPVHLVAAERKPDVLSAKTPLTYRNLRIWRFASGETFDLRRAPADRAKVIDVVDGQLSADPY
ncbi:MAG: cyanophycinase [Acidobacteriota bacterium]|nr:cyanophycinase [Acidobacteriota bacterium]